MKYWIIFFILAWGFAAEKKEKDPFISKLCTKVYYFPPIDHTESRDQSTLGFFSVQDSSSHHAYFLYRHNQDALLHRVAIDEGYTHLLSVDLDRRRSVLFALLKNKYNSAGLIVLRIKNKTLCLERVEKIDLSLSNDGTDHQIFLIGTCLCLCAMTKASKGSYSEIFRVGLHKNYGYDLRRVHEGMIDHRDSDVQSLAQRALKKLGEIGDEEEIND
jgi:hypothetical protein